MLDLSVKQIEGLDENLSYAGCYVTVEGELIDVITPLTSNSLESSIRIPTTGNLHLIIKNMREGDKMIGSVSFPIAILTNPIQWLPLFDNLEYDSLQTLPEKVDFPRIQLAVASKSSEYSSGFVDKIKSLQLKIINLEHTLASERWEFQREIGSLSSSQRYREDSQSVLIEQLKAQVEKQEILIQDLIRQKNDAKNSNEKEGLWKKDLEEKYHHLFAELEKTLKNSQERDENYLKTTSDLKKENLEFKYKIDLLTGEAFEKDLEISHLSENISHLSLENYEQMIKNLKEKLALFQSHLTESESNRGVLQQKIEKLIDRISLNKSCTNCAKSKMKIAALNEQIILMKSDLNEPENKNSEAKANFSFTPEIDLFTEPSVLDVNSDLSTKVLQLMLENKALKSQTGKTEARSEDEVDEALKQYSEMFTKVSTGQYKYKNMAVNIFMEKNVLLCRAGNVVTVQEFVTSFHQGSNSTTPGDSSFKENPKNSHEVASEIGECSYTSEEDLKRKEVKKQVLIKKQYRPDKKVFAPLRQSSAHIERKKTLK